MKKQTDLRTYLSTSFSYLKDSDINDFLSICQYKRYDNKEIVFWQGSTTRKAAFILSGFLRGYTINAEGVEKTLILRPTGTFMGVPEWLLSNQPTKYTFEAISDCELLIFYLPDIERLAKENPVIFDLYVGALKENLAILIYRIESMIHFSPEKRYQDLLAKYPMLFEVAFHKHIASFLGITPVSLSRLIKRQKVKNPNKNLF
jgi:CRP-like cAMP-binding protein